MSWRASAYVKALVVCPNGERLSRTEKLVALVLADSHQDKAKAYTFPAVKTIAEDALMDPRVCRRMLAALERKGVIVRERPERQGSGQMTFYRFPELDDPAAREKGGRVVPLSLVKKEDAASSFSLAGRRTEGGRKEDKTRTPPMEEQEQEQKPLHPPTPLAGAKGEKRAGWSDGLGSSEGLALERATDQVASALGVAESQRRKRRLIHDALKRAAEKGEPPATLALAMIDAVRKQDELHLRGQLKWKFGLQKFLGEGIWRDRNRWGWDTAALRLQAEARAGSWQ